MLVIAVFHVHLDSVFVPGKAIVTLGSDGTGPHGPNVGQEITNQKGLSPRALLLVKEPDGPGSRPGCQPRAAKRS